MGCAPESPSCTITSWRCSARHSVHGDRLRGGNRIGADHVAGAAVGGERRIVDLDRLPHVHERRAGRRVHRQRGAAHSNTSSKRWPLLKGITLGALSRSHEEIAVYDDVIARLGTAIELPLREKLAAALINKGITLSALNRSNEEIAVYESVIARFGTAIELSLREQVATALINKGFTLGTLNRNEEEISAYDDVVARFGNSIEPSLTERVAKTLLNKGITRAPRSP